MVIEKKKKKYTKRYVNARHVTSDILLFVHIKNV